MQQQKAHTYCVTQMATNTNTIDMILYNPVGSGVRLWPLFVIGNGQEDYRGVNISMFNEVPVEGGGDEQTPTKLNRRAATPASSAVAYTDMDAPAAQDLFALVPAGHWNDDPSPDYPRKYKGTHFNNDNFWIVEGYGIRLQMSADDNEDISLNLVYGEEATV